MIHLQLLKGRMAKKYFSLKKYSRFKAVIPFLFTFSNALFGFLSIIQTIEGNFAVAALCIMAAAFMDAFDGRIARYLGTTGELGTELDSLCDAVSFCLAPAVLLYSWYLHAFGHGTLFLAALGFYVCAGLLRLARFNVATEDQSVFFLGLPTTIAAFFLVQIVLYQEFFGKVVLGTVLTENIFTALVAFLAFLMVSRLRFPAFKKAKISFKNPIVYLEGIALLLGAAWCAKKGYPLILLGASLYIFGAVFLNGVARARTVIKKRKKKRS